MLEQIKALIVVGILLLPVVILMAIGGHYMEKARRRKLESRFPKGSITILNQNYLVIDHNNARIAVGRFGNPENDKKAFDLVVPATAIKNARVEMDDVVIADSEGSNGTATGALVGGMLAGPMGALGGAIGGSLGSMGNKKTTVSSKGVKKLTLIVHIVDQERPLHRLEFFSKSTPVKIDDYGFKQSLEQAETNLAHILNLMESAAPSREQVTTTAYLAPEPTFIASQPQPTGRSSADEIRELWALKESGALTQDEFERGKARLLASA